jgi:hypothetical protein
MDELGECAAPCPCPRCGSRPTIGMERDIMVDRKVAIKSMTLISLAVFLVPALGIANIGIGCILLGIIMLKEENG